MASFGLKNGGIPISIGHKFHQVTRPNRSCDASLIGKWQVPRKDQVGKFFPNSKSFSFAKFFAPEAASEGQKLDLLKPVKPVLSLRTPLKQC